MNNRSTSSPLLLALALQLGLAGGAGATAITREFTAAWFDPARPGHGIGLEVIDASGGKSAVAYWFTYDSEGNQLWLYGTAPVLEDRVEMTVYSTRGGSFDNQFDPSQVRSEAWGTIELEFEDCNHGVLRFDPAGNTWPSGQIDLTRSTRLYNSACTGGISDDQKPRADEVELVQFLSSARLPGASARLRYEERPGRNEFSIEIQDAPAGDYGLFVDDRSRGTVAVTTVGTGTRGETEFRSPVEPGKILLDFDPRGAAIELRDPQGVAFSGVFDGTSVPAEPPASFVPRGNALYEVVLEPQGNDGPELHARLEQRSDRVEFSVELEDVAAGNYDVVVGGVPRGELTVIQAPGGSEGELEFRDPVERGKLALDFDPRGQALSIERNGALVMTVIFPAEPTGPVDDNGGGGDDDGGCDDNGNDDCGDDNGGDDNGGGDDGGCDDNGNDDCGDDNGGDDNGGGDDGGCDDNGNDDCGDDNGGAPATGSSSVGLVSTGIDRDANGEASFEQTGNEREFEVEVEDLDDGSYALLVGGVERATIDVDDGEGEVKFNAPARAGRLTLDFDPRGQLIEVTRDGVTYLTGTLP